MPSRNNSPLPTSTSWLGRYWADVLMVILGLAAIHLVFVSPAFRGSEINREVAAQFGEFVGGYIGTIILLLSVVSLFSTFRTQVSTLRTQVEALKNEQEGNTQRSFENKYFQMIRMHRNNVAEVELPGVKGRATGRKVFVLLLWRACRRPDDDGKP